jgi:hypothetical protein
LRGLFVAAAACVAALLLSAAATASQARTPSKPASTRPVPSLAPAETARLWGRLAYRKQRQSLLTAETCKPSRVVFYAATDWLRLATKLAEGGSQCAQYYISVPPLVGDKTQPRGDQAWRIRALGANFHAVSEIHMGSWGQWVAANGSTWYDAGVEARRRMAIAGYDVAQGDTWSVNELSSAVRRGDGNARANARAFVRGLHDGSGSATKGIAFITGMSQGTVELSVYQARLQDWLEDAPFWSDMSAYVSDWSQELYGDVRNYAVPAAPLTARRDALNDYLQHELALGRVGPAETAAARSFLEETYNPLANAAWRFDAAFGWTNVPVADMKHYVSAQVYALRNASQSAVDRFGFAWSPKNLTGADPAVFAAESGELLERLAAAIRDSAEPIDSADPGVGACGPLGQNLWCAGDLEGATFNEGWRSFATWKPSVLAFTTAPQELPAGNVSAPITVELRTHSGVPLTASQPLPVALTSSSAGGSFATSASGPWSPSLTPSLAAGASQLTVYYRDTNVGSPAITAIAAGKTAASQVHAVVVNARVASVLYTRSRVLQVTLSLVDAAGLPIAGTSVGGAIFRSGAQFASRSGTTNAEGKVTFTIWNPARGCYSTTVTSVSAPGWDGVTPPNGFCI